MLWARRALSLATGAVFFVVLLLALIIVRTGDSFLDPEFYISQLDKNDIYEFVLADLAAAALDDRRAVEEAMTGDDIEDTPLVTSGITTDRIVSSINRAIPPDWLQGAVEHNLHELGSYVIGRSDEFTLVLRTDERADAVLAELRVLLDDSEAYEFLYERVVFPPIEGDRVGSALRATLSPRWARLQMQSILDEVSPYLKKETDEFTVHIEVSDRVEIAAAELKELLGEDLAYDLVYDNVIAPEVSQLLGHTIEGLPFGVVLSSDEVVAVLREVTPTSWVSAQAERLIDEATPYVAGQVDGFKLEVSLVDSKRRAHRVLTRLVERRMQKEVDRLPTCQMTEQGGSELGSVPRHLPTCIPPDIGSERFLNKLGISPGAEVTLSVLDPIPDTLSYTHTHLRSALEEDWASENIARLDEVRSVLKDGWTYTQEDLRADLTAEGNESAYEALQDVRSLLADGWTYTLADFTEYVSENDGAIAMADIDRGRSTLSTIRTYGWLLYLVAFLLLACIGFLGGRGWPGRVQWGAASLIVCAGLIAVLFGLVYPTMTSIPMEDARRSIMEEIDSTNDYAETARLAVGKGFDVIESMTDEFTRGVVTSSLLLVVAGVVVLAVAISRRRFVEATRRARDRWAWLRSR